MLENENTAEDVPTFNLCWPPSCCQHCRQRLRWWHNIPIISFILLRGRCYYCERAISLCYPLIELLTGALTASVFVYYQTMGMNILWLSAAYLFIWILIAIAAIDWQTQLIPDELSILLLWCGLFYNGVCNLLITPAAAILGAIFGYLVLWFVALVYRAVRKRDGMGYGDFKMLSALGAWFGIWNLPIVLLTASGVALLVVFCRFILCRHFNWRQQLPFGPFLALSGLAQLLIF